MKKVFLTFIVILLIVGLLWLVSSSRTFQLFGKIVNRVDTDKKVVALTFDDGPAKGVTDTILEILDKENVKATFFLKGKELEKYLDEAKNIALNGHEIGNHSYSHKRMVFKSMDFITEEIERSNKLIQKAGYNGTIYFRPPYGKKLFMLPYFLSENNITSISWDIEAETHLDKNATPDEISKYVVKHVKPGSIILLHVMYPSRINSLNAVPLIIDELKGRGYEFVTVSELLNEERLIL